MTAYQRGDYREKQAKAVLEEFGYTVWQARGSHGVADLIALRRESRPLLVQVKTGSTVEHYEWNKLYRLADELGATPLVVTCERLAGTRVLMHWTRVLDLHVPQARTWPGRPYDVLDER